MKRTLNSHRYTQIILLVATLFIIGFIQAKAANAIRKDSVKVWGKLQDLATNEGLGKGMFTTYDERDSIIFIGSLYQKDKWYWGTREIEVEAITTRK